MAYISARDLFSDSQALVSSAVATNVKPTEGLPIGAGAPMWIVYSVIAGADFTTTDETYQFDLYTSASANMSSPVALESRVIPAATLLAGYQFTMRVPQNGLLAYLAPHYTLGGTTPSITITSWLTDEEPAARSGYAFGVTNPV